MTLSKAEAERGFMAASRARVAQIKAEASERHRIEMEALRQAALWAEQELRADAARRRRG